MNQKIYKVEVKNTLKIAECEDIVEQLKSKNNIDVEGIMAALLTIGAMKQRLDASYSELEKYAEKYVKENGTDLFAFGKDSQGKDIHTLVKKVEEPKEEINFAQLATDLGIVIDKSKPNQVTITFPNAEASSLYKEVSITGNSKAFNDASKAGKIANSSKYITSKPKVSYKTNMTEVPVAEDLENA